MLVFLRDFLIIFIFNLMSYDAFASNIQNVKLTKTVTNMTQNSEAATWIDAEPGDVIEYNIYVSNTTDSAISNIYISASIPEFTVSTAIIDCNDGHLPLALGCEIMTPDGINRSGYQGAITWQLVGKLEAGVTARVSYQVVIK